MDTETISIIGIITNAVIGIFGLVIMMYGIHQQQLVTSQNNNSVSKKKGSSATLIGVVIIIIAIIFAINGQSNLTSKSTYPDVAGQYDGSIHNTYLKTTTTLRLLINQNKGNINGKLILGPHLRGSGPFSGTVDSSGNIHFTVHSNEYGEPFSYSGTVEPNGSVSGTYCNTIKQNQCDPKGEGTWIVRSG